MEKEADMEHTLPSVSSRNKILSRFGVTGFELLLNSEEAGTPLPLGSMRMALPPRPCRNCRATQIFFCSGSKTRRRFPE
jgi:hypothetical protein